LVRHDFEERKAAAELIENGYGEKALSRVLAVSRSLAKKWIYECRAVGREAFLAMGSKHRTYGYETKLAAVRDFLEGGMTKREVMARHGIASLTALERWVRDYGEGGPEALRPRPKGRPRGAKSRPREATREQELEARVRRLEAENAYLKKSIALKAEKRSRTARRPRP
jgi:transposase-like protein